MSSHARARLRSPCAALAALVVALVVALVAAACGGPPAGGLAALRAMPEFSLAPADAVAVGSVGIEASTSIDGPIPAIAGHTYGCSASQADIVTFYNGYFARHGWAGTNLTAQRSTTETAAIAWKQGAIIFRLAFLTRGEDPRLPSASVQATYPTLFLAQLIDHRALDSPADS